MASLVLYISSYPARPRRITVKYLFNVHFKSSCSYVYRKMVVSCDLFPHKAHFVEKMHKLRYEVIRLTGVMAVVKFPGNCSSCDWKPWGRSHNNWRLLWH